MGLAETSRLELDGPAISMSNVSAILAAVKRALKVEVRAQVVVD